MPRPAVFLDRDGVLIENVPTYVREWDEVQPFDDAFEACRRLADSEYAVFVVTNQSGVGRGIIPEAFARSLNARILDEFRSRGARFEGVYMCVHHPDEACDCRKPMPGMLRRAATEFGVDLSRSFMVGDAVSDLEAGSAAGARGILVRTGRGADQEHLLDNMAPRDWIVVDRLSDAIDLILK